MSKKWLLFALTALVVVGSPIAYSTVFGGGTARYGYISIFTDPTTESEVGTARLNDAHARGEKGSGLNPTFLDRLIHNKFTFWSGNILRNYYKPFSTEFLFIKGDLNLRHSIGIGEFYKIDALILILGVIYFFANKSGNRKIKLLLIFWIFAGVLPAVITRDGGNHATRLIIILPALIYLISCGLLSIQSNSAHVHKKFIMAAYAVILLVSIGFYQHEYWSHYPFASERWWHAGYKESFDEIKRIESKYDKVIISTANEPPWIFFAGLYEYDPKLWQAEFPIGNDTHVPGFGKISHTGKFYFGSPEGGLYDWGKVLDSKTLYLATSKEVNVNLILEPERAPSDIRLVKAIAFPSGEPAYYLFDKK